MKTNKILRVWWIPQVPMDPFIVVVHSLLESKKILEVLENYDSFQFENKIKPDYSNAGGLQMFNEGLAEWEEYESEDGRSIDEITVEELMALEYQND